MGDYVDRVDSFDISADFKDCRRITFAGLLGLGSLPRERRSKGIRVVGGSIGVRVLDDADPNKSVAGMIRVWTPVIFD